jgi:hypothetical protein
VVSVSQLGYHNEIKTLDLSDQGVIELQFFLKVDPVQLPGMTAFGDAACPIPDDPERVIQLVGEVRSTLASRLRPTLTIRYERRVQEVGPHHHLYADDPWNQTWTRELALDTIILQTDEPLQDLGLLGSESGGFIQLGFAGGDAFFAYHFLAPSVEMIVSEPFARTHCFDVTPEQASDGSLGLSFTPKGDSLTEYDVDGVLWVSRQPNQLPWIEFNFTQFPPAPTGAPLESTIDLNRHLRDVRAGRVSMYPYPRELVKPDERFGGRLDWRLHDPGVWLPDLVEIRSPVVSQGEDVAESHQRRLRKFWLVTRVRRTTYRLLSAEKH